MIKSLVIWFTFFSSFHTIIEEKEKYPFSKWDKETIANANTAKDVKYMTSDEKEVIFLCNLARTDGKLFSETYLKQYVDSMELQKNNYITSLYTRLKKVKKLPLLKPQEDLYNAAKAHVDDTGKKGSIGHQNVTSRFKKHAPRYEETAENCDYGSDKAIDIVMSLLIDEGVTDKGHRENILDKTMLSVGVSIGDHKKYDFTCVMDFGDLE